MGDGAFESCSALTNIVLGTNITLIGVNEFADDSTILSIVIPPSVTNIGAGAFFQCSALTNLVLPEGLSGNIGDGTFYQCSNLTRISIPKGISSIGNSAFVECDLSNIVVPASVTNIGDYAFVGCNALTNVVILGTCNIGESAFSTEQYISETPLPIQSIYIAGGVIGSSAFQNCTNLKSAILGDGVTTLDDFAFCGDPISSLFIPPSVTYIGQEALSCDLTNLVIASKAAKIADYAFEENFHLTNVLFLGNSPTVMQNGDMPPFGRCPATIYYLPGTSGWSNTFGQTIYFDDGAPTAVWNPVIQTTDGHFGTRSNQFGFNITGTANIPVVVEVCTNLGNPTWMPLASVILTNGSYYFSEPLQTNTPRFYGLGFP